MGDLSEEELLIYFEDPQFEIGYEELTLFDEVEWKK